MRHTDFLQWITFVKYKKWRIKIDLFVFINFSRRQIHFYLEFKTLNISITIIYHSASIFFHKFFPQFIVTTYLFFRKTKIPFRGFLFTIYAYRETSKLINSLDYYEGFTKNPPSIGKPSVKVFAMSAPAVVPSSQEMSFAAFAILNWKVSPSAS